MDEFPTSEDEFDLMYGDEMDVLREHGDIERSPKKSRKSLDFTPTTQNTNSTSTQQPFEEDFTPIEENVPETSSGNKRTIEDLFGDIDDILYEGGTQKAKRRKSNEHSDELALIEHIIQLRKLAKERECPDLVRKDYTSADDRDKNNLSYNVPNYPFVGVTRYDGQRVYVRCHSEQYEREDRDRIVNEISSSGTLGINKELWEEAQKLLLKQTEGEIQDVDVVDSTDNELWVNLYKPRKYFELLSEESTNRIMLSWIKLWDKVVFKRRPKIKVEKPKETNPYVKKKTIELNTDLDENGRPYHKVALLCGPPGLGKTTLAHMVAKHAGYNVVEVNASDDRNLDAFKTLLENATQMRSVIDAENRPNCLIFDEIDGAPSNSIDYLVKFITGAATSKKKKSQQEKINVLKRPIICICNDVYVPSLRPLRQIAFVVNFPPTSNTRLAERLMEIAKWQHIKTDMGAMLALAEKSQNDIRSCLSVLHFFKAQNKPVTLSDVHKSSVGQKDTQKGIFAVWQDIFLIDRTSRVGSESKYATLRERMSRILDVVNSFGDYEKVAQGVFENYPNVKFKSSNMRETCLALEWFSYSDLLNTEVFATQNYDLMTYLQYAFVVWHFTFGSRTWQKLQYPSAGYEARVKRNRQKAIIGELMRGMQPSIRSYVQPVSLILDVLPLLSIIIVPSFRPINLHLYTEEEKKCLEHVVNVMIDYNLNYVQERSADGSYEYKLDHNIDEIVTFSQKKSLSYSNKQLIAQEIETTKMRRFETALREKPGHQEKPSSTLTAAAVTKKPTTQTSTALLPNHLQTLKAKSVNSVEMPAPTKDFFGRTIAKKSSSSSSGKSSQDAKNDIWYQYKEGYNNAVRKKIKVSSLK